MPGTRSSVSGREGLSEGRLLDPRPEAGTGIGSPSGLAVSYKAGTETGIAIYSQAGDTFAGYWTYAGGKTVGQETWSTR